MKLFELCFNVNISKKYCTAVCCLWQVVFFMYLWSVDIEAVLTAMSCFRLLCEEADIRCGADEVAVTQLLPNYGVYLELAAASNALTTGACVLEYSSPSLYMLTLSANIG